MKIGIFDSGLGGLFTMKAITQKLPEYDYIYLGDTKRLPYGGRSHETIYEFLKEGIDFLFSKNCALIVVACNTASSEALRVLQQNYLKEKYPNKRVLGMIVPIVEECVSYKNVGIIGTQATIRSSAYQKEFIRQNSKAKIIGIPTPLLVPIIESGETKWIKPTLKDYLTKFKGSKINALILGCTHYAIIKKEIRTLIPQSVKIISQDEIIPKKLELYLEKHPEIKKILSQGKKRDFYVTDITVNFQKIAQKWFGKDAKLISANIEK